MPPDAFASSETSDSRNLPVPIQIEDALDLHAFAARDIPSVVNEYLHEACARGFAEVRLIHGRGIGVQRRIVQSLLAKHALVTRYADAPPERGGPGATIVWLMTGSSPTTRDPVAGPAQ